MAIDALVAWVRRVDDGLELDLVPRNSQSGPAGQYRLVIINPIFIPSPGATIWGSELLHLRDGNSTYHYRRIGYTRMVELSDRGFGAEG